MLAKLLTAHTVVCAASKANLFRTHMLFRVLQLRWTKAPEVRPLEAVPCHVHRPSSKAA